MRRSSTPFVLFAVAAGPELGFGHLVRAGVLADALGVARHLVLRGQTPAVEAALRFGWTVHVGRDVLDELSPDLLVIDDPSAAECTRWTHRARRLQIPVASVHDGGSAKADSDVVIDGSVTAPVSGRSNHLAGPAFAILNPQVSALRRKGARRTKGRMLIALGGGAHVQRVGVALAEALVSAVPGLRIDLAAGFVLDGHLPALPTGCCWLHAPHGLARPLSRASVVVVAGGITLYEACAVGCVAIGVPVVAAQRPAIRAAARAGAILDVSGRDGRVKTAAVVDAVRRVLGQPARAALLAKRAQRLVDGHGAQRVAQRLLAVAAGARTGGWRHAA